MVIQEFTRQDRNSTRLESSSVDRVWIESTWTEFYKKTSVCLV